MKNGVCNQRKAFWLGRGGAICILWIRGRTIGKGIDFPDIGIRNGLDFHNFGVRNGSDFKLLV